MPVYEYKCKKCGHRFEELLFHGDEKVLCPECKGAVIRLLSPFSVAVPDEVCGKLPRGLARERCTECRQGGSGCSAMA